MYLIYENGFFSGIVVKSWKWMKQPFQKDSMRKEDFWRINNSYLIESNKDLIEFYSFSFQKN